MFKILVPKRLIPRNQTQTALNDNGNCIFLTPYLAAYWSLDDCLWMALRKQLITPPFLFPLNCDYCLILYRYLEFGEWFKSSQRDKLYLKANARVFLAETQKVLRLHKSVAILVARLEDSFQMHQNILHVHF